AAAAPSMAPASSANRTSGASKTPGWLRRAAGGNDAASLAITDGLRETTVLREHWTDFPCRFQATGTKRRVVFRLPAPIAQPAGLHRRFGADGPAPVRSRGRPCRESPRGQAGQTPAGLAPAPDPS